MFRMMEEIQNKYQEVINAWLKDNKVIPTDLREILDRGFWLCLDNPQEGLLLTGVNPSNGKPGNCAFRDCTGTYWEKWQANLQHALSHNKAGYVDLFPLRVSKQKAEFERIVPLELKAEILRVTQAEIERLQPQLIIHANKSSAFYYGTNPKHPWMGYDLEQIKLPVGIGGKGVLYKIRGVQDNEDRILATLHETKLNYLFVCPYQNCQYLTIHPEKKMDADEVDLLCNYLNVKI